MNEPSYCCSKDHGRTKAAGRESPLSTHAVLKTAGLELLGGVFTQPGSIVACRERLQLTQSRRWQKAKIGHRVPKNVGQFTFTSKPYA